MNDMKCLREWSWIFAEGLGRAYGFYKQGTLGNVKSLESAQPFYYFVPEGQYEAVSPKQLGGNGDGAIYDIDFEPKLRWGSYWEAPPLKKHYYDLTVRKLNTDKEIIVINNKYADEWKKDKCFNFIDLDTLKRFFEKFQDEYEIYYLRYNGFRINEGGGYFDDQNTLKFDDYELIKSFPKVKTIYDFMDYWKISSFNEAQCMILSMSDKHISTAGGGAVLSSYFAGENLIYTHPNCKATDRGIWKTDSWLKLLGEKDSKIYGFLNYNDLLKKCENLWL